MTDPETGRAPARPVLGPATRDTLPLRIASGAALGAAAIGATWLGGPVFAAIVAAMAVLMCFEWTRMVERRAYSRAFQALAGGGALATAFAAGGLYAPAFALVALAGLAAWRLASEGPLRVWTALAAPYILGPSAALLWLRSDVENGRALTLLLFAIVWSADSAAYLAGRFIGGPRLSPALSPMKTWSGAAGGVLAGALAGAVGAVQIYGDGNIPTYAVIGGSLGLASILGDMTESAFKRIFGVKDMSGFIPGHGGVLDRLDGMIFATTAMTTVIFGLVVLGR